MRKLVKRRGEAKCQEGLEGVFIVGRLADRELMKTWERW